MKVKFLPQNISVDIKQGKSVMELARESKIPVSSSCNGMCSCAECRVYVVDGSAHVLPPSTKEVELIGGGHFIDNRRLSCQLFCFGDVTVDLSEQVERENEGKVMKKRFLKQIATSDSEGSASIGGILVEQDQEMDKVSIDEKESHASLGDEFYKKTSHRRDTYRKRGLVKRNMQGRGKKPTEKRNTKNWQRKLVNRNKKFKNRKK